MNVAVIVFKGSWAEKRPLIRYTMFAARLELDEMGLVYDETSKVYRAKPIEGITGERLAKIYFEEVTG